MKDLYNFYEDSGPERCGFILDDGQIIEVENKHELPTEGFEIDSQEILNYLPEIKGIWHTHPGGTEVLSGADKSYMMFWPDVDHYVVGKRGIRIYKVKGEALINESYISR